MGASTSVAQNVNQVTNTALSNTYVNNSSSCSSSTDQYQSISLSNITAADGCTLNFQNISQTAIAMPKVDCLFTAQTTNDFQASFEAELKQAAEAATSGFQGAFVTTSVSNNINNYVAAISSSLNFNTLNTCVSTVIQTQMISLDKIFSSCPFYCRIPNCSCDNYDYSFCVVYFQNITQSAISEGVLNCLANQTVYNSVAADIAVEISQEATAKNTGISLLDSGIIIAVIVFLILALLLMRTGAGPIMSIITGLVLLGGGGYFTYQFITQDKFLWQGLVALILALLGLLILILTIVNMTKKPKVPSAQKTAMAPVGAAPYNMPYTGVPPPVGYGVPYGNPYGTAALGLSSGAAAGSLANQQRGGSVPYTYGGGPVYPPQGSSVVGPAVGGGAPVSSVQPATVYVNNYTSNPDSGAPVANTVNEIAAAQAPAPPAVVVASPAPPASVGVSVVRPVIQ